MAEAKIRQRALDLVSQQYDPKTRELNRGLSNLENALARDVGTQQQFARSGDRTIADAFGLLGSQLQEGVGLTRGIYDQGTKAVGAQYDQASQYNQNALDRVLGEVNSNANRLGLQAAVPQGEANLRGNLAEIEALNQTGKASSMANMTELGTNMIGIAQKGVANAQREGADKRAGLQSQIANAILELQAQGAQGRTNFLDELVGVESDRGKATRTTIEQLMEEEQERQRQARVDALQEEIQRGQLALAQRAQQAQEAQFAQELALKRQALTQERDMAMRRLTAEKASQGRTPTKAEYNAVAAKYEKTWGGIMERVQGDAGSIVAHKYPKPAPSRGGFSGIRR